MSFENLGLSKNALKTIERLGFKEPTTIQKKSIPLILEGKDVVGESATGSGKTLAFGAGIIERTEPGKGIQALVMTPTRELAEQVSQAMRSFSKEHKVVSVYGGASINPQIKELKDADVVVGTPGRILDHIERQTIQLKGIETLVLDEADRMLDMGFIDDVEKIIKQCSEDRQTLLFSATIPNEVGKISQRHMNGPTHIKAEPQVDPSKLKQHYYDVSPKLKFSLLAHLLENEDSSLAMVFTNTRKMVDILADNLQKQGINAIAIHGGLSQAKRDAVMKEFHSGKTNVLICTDVAARGLDINDVSHIYNYDIPPTTEDYTHRIGRTARAGKKGKAINLLTSKDYVNLRRVMGQSNFEIEEARVPQIKPIRLNMGRQRGNEERFRSKFKRKKAGSKRAKERKKVERGKKQKEKTNKKKSKKR